MTYMYIAFLALITFSCRYFFFSRLVDYSIPKEIERLLQFTAPAVLTAMWAPIVFVSNTVTQPLDSPYFVAGIITIVCSLLTKRMLLVVAIGILSFNAHNLFANVL